MARVCTVCGHPNRDTIDDGLVTGVSYRELQRRFDVTPSALSRHRLRHLSPALTALKIDYANLDRETLLDRIEVLFTRTEALLGAAMKSGSMAQALGAMRELRQLLELLGRATGELDTRPVTVVNLQTSPEWLAVRAALFAALQPYPAAREAVSGRLLQLEAGDGT